MISWYFIILCTNLGDLMNLYKEILKLKKEKNALILVHNYQNEEIKQFADYLGDSLELSKIASNSKNPLIVFCGVRFMAETAKILSPSTKVIIPRIDAGCPMADMAEIEKLKKFKQKYPDAALCIYVNSYAGAKAISDVCCTSANAVKIVNSLPYNQVIFAPDKNLASWVAKNSNKKIIPFDGFCYVHEKFSKEDVIRSKSLHPDAVLISHPECTIEVLEISDMVASTSGMIAFAKESDKKEFILGTERGVIEQLIKELPDKKFYSLGPACSCFNMKKTTVMDIYESLLHEKTEIVIPEDIIIKAKRSLDYMLKLSK